MSDERRQTVRGVAIAPRSVGQSGHGSGSCVAVSEPVFQPFTFRRGLVVRQEDFLGRSQALAAAGWREPGC